MTTQVARAFYFVRKLLLVCAGMVAASGLVNPPRSLAQSLDANPAITSRLRSNAIISNR